jgi:hypothetical protein
MRQLSLDVLAVTDAVADAGGCGAIVYWTLAGKVDYDDLEVAWNGAGLDAKLLPTMVSDETALRRALALFAKGRPLIRPLKGNARGFILVDEQYDDTGRPTYSRQMEVVLRDDGTIDMSGLADDVSEGVWKTYLSERTHLSHEDLGPWLVKLASIVSSVRLRESGGFYFVPAPRLAEWRAFAAVVRAETRCTLYEIPAMTSSETVAAVLDAVTSEAREAVDRVREDIDAWDSKPGARSVRVRTERLAAVSAKLEQYEQLLGVKLEELRASVEDAGARLAEAALLGDESG